MVGVEQDQAANNEVGGTQQRCNPQHKQLQQQREPEKETRLCHHNFQKMTSVILMLQLD